MQKYFISGLIGLFLVLILACGSDPTAVPAATATTPPQSTTAPQATTPSSATSATTLTDIAAKLAGGPGSIFVGDLNQLVGPAPGQGLGDDDNQVPLAMLQKHRYLVDSDYYKSLLEKANLTNPTELTSTGEEFNIQYACINRALQPCILSIVYFAPNILERTNGQVDFEIVSYPELGIAGPDMMDLIGNGTISFGQVQPAYVGGTMPLIDILYMWGMWKDHGSEHKANTAILPALDAAVGAQSGDAKVVYHIWYAGNDQYFFSKRKFEKPSDFDGMKTRSHGTTMTDYINGFGGEGQFIAFAEVYTALERGILEAGVTGGDAGFGQRWYEVTDYINGPLVSFPSTNNVINGGVWAKIPPDLQQILLEEGAKSELEALRIASIQNEMGLAKNTDAGLEFVPFSTELQELSRQTTMGNVIPGWLRRLGGADKPIIKVFNDKVGPIVGLHINEDGTVDQIESRR